jgi:predicted GNAT family N-acyltransferase
MFHFIIKNIIFIKLSKMETIIDDWKKLKDDAYVIRFDVFVKEQGFSELTEVTELDEKCVHCVIYIDKIPVGTARLYKENMIGKLGRICVLEKYRNKHIGSLLIKNLREYAIKVMKISHLTLNAQTNALDFYKKNGFVPIPDTENTRNGIPHIEMISYIDIIYIPD